MSMLFDVYMVHMVGSHTQHALYTLLPSGKGMGIGVISVLECEFFMKLNDCGHLVNFNKLDEEITAEETEQWKLFTQFELIKLLGESKNV